jgi:ribosomal protein L19E
MNKELAKKPQKSFSKSTVKFNTEVVSTFNKPRTREEIRELVGAQNIQQETTGVGYQTIGQNNTIA